MSASAHRSAADRTRPTLWDALVAAAVLAAAALLFLSLRPASSSHLSAEIVLEHQTVARYDLNGLTGPISLSVEGAAYPVTVELEPGRVRILDSACPGADCVRTGWADRPGQQIICLPNRLIISLTGDGPLEDGIDGVTH